MLLCHSLSADGVNSGEVDLGIMGAQFYEKLQDFVVDSGRIGGLLVYFIYDNYGNQSQFQGFLQDEACLRHWAFLGIDD